MAQLVRGLKKMAARATVEERDLGSDAELLRVLLDVHLHLDIGGQLGAALGPLLEWTGADCGFGIGPAADGKKLEIVASTLPKDDPRPGSFKRLEPARVKKTLGERPTLYEGVGPVASFVNSWPDPIPVACASLPVTDSDSRWRGVVLLLFAQRPGDEPLRRATRLLELARPAVSQSVLMARMRELVIKDDTAQCFNRRHFEESLPEELSRASRFRAPLSLIFLDMDNLKSVNNRYGHAMGSRVLYEVSTRIRRKIRKFDKLFRFGGDEFCILLPESAWHGAMEVAERVRDAVARKPFLTTELGRDSDVWMTASLGIAAYPLHARSSRALVHQADRAMQEIKRGTKNGIGVAEICEDEDES